MQRCEWANSTLLEAKYHDEEWGVPVHDDRLLFEMLTLEGAQAGLSWRTILNKRLGYRAAFANFEITKVAQYSEQKITELLENPNIVRNKLKVNATVVNAQRILEIQQAYGSFDAYIWSFVDGKPIENQWQQLSDVPANTELSDKMSKEMKQKGFKFIGSITCYAFMQAVGMVNDHVVSCFRYSEVKDM